jgi:hypothetical protein
MDANSGNVSGSDSRASIPRWSRVSFGSPDAWVDEEGYGGATAPRKEGAHLTHLLWTRQVDAELGKSFHRTALRLETVIADRAEGVRARHGTICRFKRVIVTSRALTSL